MDRMRGELDHYGQGLKGHVRVLCNTTALSEYLPAVLGDFLKDHPRVSVDLQERLSYEIADALRAGTCDIGVLADSTDLQGLQVARFRHDPLALVVPPDHRLAGRETALLADVADEEFVGPVEGSALQEHIAHHAPRRQGSVVPGAPAQLRCGLPPGGPGRGHRHHAARRRRAPWPRGGRAAPRAGGRLGQARLVLCVRGELPAYAQQLVAYALRDAPRS